MLLTQIFLQCTHPVSLACKDYFLLVVLPALQVVKQTPSFSIHGTVDNSENIEVSYITYMGSLVVLVHFVFSKVFWFRFGERDFRLILYRFMLF